LTAPPIPADALARVEATARDLADDPMVRGFALAVASDPVAASRALGADAVVEVFRTDDAAEAAGVLAALEGTFGAHAKRRVVDPIPQTPGMRRVFLALWAAPEA
jgi:hypothetical protein